MITLYSKFHHYKSLYWTRKYHPVRNFYKEVLKKNKQKAISSKPPGPTEMFTKLWRISLHIVLSQIVLVLKTNRPFLKLWFKFSWVILNFSDDLLLYNTTGVNWFKAHDILQVQSHYQSLVRDPETETAFLLQNRW